MRRCPAIYDAHEMILTPEKFHHPSVILPGHRIVPARTHRTYTLAQRLRATWLVFTGRADALIWPGQEG